MVNIGYVFYTCYDFALSISSTISTIGFTLADYWILW